MKTFLLMSSLGLALPVAVTAFFLGNFIVLASLCAYVTLSSLVVCALSLWPDSDEPEFDLDLDEV